MYGESSPVYRLWVALAEILQLSNAAEDGPKIRKLSRLQPKNATQNASVGHVEPNSGDQLGENTHVMTAVHFLSILRRVVAPHDPARFVSIADRSYLRYKLLSPMSSSRKDYSRVGLDTALLQKEAARNKPDPAQNNKRELKINYIAFESIAVELQHTLQLQ